MGSFFGRSMKSLLPWLAGAERNADRRQPGMELATSEQKTLFLRLDPMGNVIEQSEALRCLLPRTFHPGQPLSDATTLALPWLLLPPAQWPRSLPLLEFSGDQGPLMLAGVLGPEPDGWLLGFNDLTTLMGRQRILERLQRLQQATASQVARLGRSADPEAVVWDWLEQLSLQLGITSLSVVMKEQGRWRVCGQYQRPGTPASGLTAEDITAWSEIHSEQPGLKKTYFGTQVWSVPFSDEFGPKAWLLCPSDTPTLAKGLRAEDWLQLFSTIASALSSRLAKAHDSEFRQRYESLAKIGAGGWWEYNLQDRTVRISPGLETMLDVTSTEPLSQEEWLQLLDPMDRETFLMHVDEAVRGNNFTHSYRLRRGGQSVWYRFDAQLLGQDRSRRLLGFALDIHTLHEREEEADATKARLAGLVDSAPGIIYVQHYNEGAFRFAFCSGSVTELLGWTPEEWQEQPFAPFVHPDDRATYLKKGSQLLRQDNVSLQYRVRDRQGDYHWLQDDTKLLRDHRGVPREAVGIYVDISKDKEAAARIFRSEESYRALVDDSPAIICRYRPDLTVLFANPALASALSVPHAEVKGVNLGDYLSEAQREEALTRLSLLTPRHPAVTSEICIRRPDMEARWWVMYEQGLFDEEGKLQEVQSVGRDNTEVHFTRQQLFQSAKMATLGEMATGLAHEINQPLSVIQMTLANLVKRVESGQVPSDLLLEKLDRISSQVVRAAGIVKHVRVFGRWSGVDGVLFSPSQAVEGALSLMGQKLELSGVTLVIDGLEHLPAVKGQPDRLEQVVVNVMANALHAMMERKQKVPELIPTLTICAEIIAEQVCLMIEDNGGGIPPAILGKVFEPFFTTKSLDQGTGLGLSVSREIISQMSGRLLAENYEEGARMIIELPVADVTDVEEVPVEEPVLMQSGLQQ